jgi:hypothetical protein
MSGTGTGTGILSSTPRSIELDLRVEIDAQNELNLFGVGTGTMPSVNVIVPELHLPVDCFYDATENAKKGLIEFWEPSQALGDIYCRLASKVQGDSAEMEHWKDTSKVLARNLQRMFCGAFDASAAYPFSNYTSTLEYYKPAHFGRLVLGLFAHDIFGHVAATAGVVNDAEMMESLLSVTDGLEQDDNLSAEEGVAERYDSWVKKTAAMAPPSAAAWNTPASNIDSNLALRMAWAIISKGMTSGTPDAYQSVNTNGPSDDTKLTYIVQQVLSQDPSRMKDADNNQFATDTHQFLKFYPGDVVYVSVKVKEPTYAGSSGLRPATKPAERIYNIKITLTDKASGVAALV